MSLRIALLGGFTLSNAEAAISLPYAKLAALLSYLVVETPRTGPIRREALAEMLWPELPPENARGNLRRALFNLQQAFGGDKLPLFKASRGSLTLSDTAPLWLDVAEYAAIAAACPSPVPAAYCGDCLSGMEKAVELYRGDFMAGFVLPDSPDFEDWMLMKREAFARHALALLERIAVCYEQKGAYGKALPYVLRCTELEPWSEPAYRRAMRLYALSGQSGSALTLFEACCRILEKELGVTPDAETLRLAEAIRSGELQAEAGMETPPVIAMPPLVGEKRQVTVLYCKLTPCDVDDPEEAIECLHQPKERCYTIIQRCYGHCVQTHGGGFLAYFGYPKAHEYAARWAVQAALDITRTNIPGIDIRCGVHTGAIITSGDLSLPDAIGKTSGLTIQLWRLAGRAEAVISDDTQRLTSVFFETHSLGTHAMRGALRPLEVFSVIRESGARHRLDLAARPDFTLTPLIGRDGVIAELLALWQQACRGDRRVLLLRGEPGIGKSRLVLALQERLRNAAAVRELHCFQEYSRTPFYPCIVLFESLLGFAPSDTPQHKLSKLAAYLADHHAPGAESDLSLLANWLGLPSTAGYNLSSLSLVKQKTLDLLQSLLLTPTAQQPLLLIVEDLHWADPSTLEFLTRFIQQNRPATTLALLTARPEFEPPWRHNAVINQELPALSSAEVAHMVHALVDDIPAQALNWILARADGVPLFIEEMARMAPLPSAAAIPATLHDLLAARLDGTGDAKRVAQLAATVGREFSVELLRRISPLPFEALTSALQELHNSRLIVSHDAGTCQFKHALICEAAYQSQPKTQRQATHREIARVLQTQFAEVIEARPEVVAQHLALAGETHPAIDYWLKAGKRAEKHAANHEAMDHYAAALQLVQKQPIDQERDRLEFVLQVKLGILLHATEGYGSIDATQAFFRALALCGNLDDSPEVFQALWGLWVGTLDHSFPAALELAHKLSALAEAIDEPFLRVQAHYVTGNNAFWLGDFAAAQHNLELALALYQPAQHEPLVAQFGENAAITSGTFLSWTLWLRGYSDQARRVSEHTLALAQQLGHPHSLGFAMACAAILRRWIREVPAVSSLAEATLAFAQQHGFALWQATGALARGWGMVMQGEAQGVVHIEQSIHAMRTAMGSAAVIFLAPLAEAHMHLGCHEAALLAVNKALYEVEKKGDRHFEAELHRLKGECLLASTPNEHGHQSAEAEACFQQALVISRRQGAKALELRAAMSMAQLWRQQGRQDEARRVLAGVYAGFSEGFDTPDMQEADDLLCCLA